MAFPMNLASVLTGATLHQLRSWRSKGLVVPEERAYRPPLYSFRDLIVLRSIVYLRSDTSLQRVSKAFASLDLLDLSEHPSKYKFGTDGKTVYVDPGDGSAVDLTNKVGQETVFTFADLVKQFKDFRGRDVVDFRRPAEHIEIEYRRLGGWPTIEGTRVMYDTIARLVDNETVFAADVSEYYPSVSTAAAESAVAFDERIQAVA